MGSVKWTRAQGGLDMQCEEVLRNVRVWMGEFDCLCLQQRPRYKIEVGLATGALCRLAGDLGVPMDHFGDNSGSDGDEAGPSGSGRFLVEDLTEWGQGRRGERVVRRVDFSAGSDLFGVSVTGVLGIALQSVGKEGPVPAPGICGAVRAVPALPQMPRSASPLGGEGRGTEVAGEDVDMGGMNVGGVVPGSGREERGCGCDCRTVLARVRRKMASQVSKMREEVMGALSLLLVERGLGMWEEGRRLENTWERLERVTVTAQREHKVRKIEASILAFPEVVAVGPSRAAGGVVTRKVEVVTRLNGPVGRTRTVELRGVVEKVQPRVRQRGHAA